jgi:hypothetical protein
MFCRRELYKEGEQEKTCEDHIDGPIECVHIHEPTSEE